MAIITVRSDDSRYQDARQPEILFATSPENVRVYPVETPEAEKPAFQPVRTWVAFRLFVIRTLIHSVGTERILQSSWNANDNKRDGLYPMDEIIARGISQGSARACWPEGASKDDAGVLLTTGSLSAPQHFVSCGILAAEMGYVFEVKVNINDGAEEAVDVPGEAATPVDAQPVNHKEEFRRWMLQKNMSRNTVSNYCSYIQTAERLLPVEGYASAFEIGDAETLGSYTAELYASPDFLDYQYQNYIAYAFTAYDKFLKDQHPIAKDIEALRRDLENMPRNLIVFGAPGTGKSFYLEAKRKEYEKCGLLGEPDSKHWERVTFHPDYSYANFVGTYKPTADGRDITYKFVPGPFLRLLVKALKNPEVPYLLIVEEINRAEPAAVFGDVFQLLDRNKDNKSEYAICPSEDMKAYLAENGIGSDTLSLPENFYLWATMNSADQGVFPMDTAFKRRWEFKYIGVDDNATELENEKIELKPKKSEPQNFCWDFVRRKINDRLAESKINEDKQLGPFFLKLPKNDAGIDAERFADLFKNKVLMYLFEDAARQKRNTMFEGCKDETRFSKLCEKFNQIGLKIFGDGFCEGICLSEEEVRLEQQAEEEFEEAQQEQADEIREEAPAEA